MNFELFAVFFVPWLLDLIGGRAVMATLFGALLWGGAIILVSARSQLRDPKVSRALLLVIWALSGAWLSYWLFALSNEPQHQQWLGRPLQWLAWTHAGLLSAGAACIFVAGLFAVLWLWGERRVNQGSWERRGTLVHLPSLEASARICYRALMMGVFAWTCGLLLASTSGFVQWSAGIGNFAGAEDGRWSWARDSKFVVASALWAWLVIGTFLVQRLSKNSYWRFLAVLLITVVFVLGFYCLLTLDTNTRHIPVRWFVP